VYCVIEGTIVEADSIVVVVFCVVSPLMLNTQRLSSMAFNLRDGSEIDASKLSPMMKRLAVKSVIPLSVFTHNYCMNLR